MKQESWGVFAGRMFGYWGVMVALKLMATILGLFPSLGVYITVYLIAGWALMVEIYWSPYKRGGVHSFPFLRTRYL